MSITKIRVSPSGFDGVGFFECSEEQAIVFSVGYFGREKGYGEGWFPAYDLNMKYQYRTRQEAEEKAREFRARKGLSHIQIIGLAKAALQKEAQS